MYVTDGGLETELIFHDGMDLPHFAAFTLVDDDAGQERLTRYWQGYADIAKSGSLGLAIDAPTWRANADWGSLLGLSEAELAAVNGRAMELMREIADALDVDDMRIGGTIGPRGDGYRPGARMTSSEARAYHAAQAEALAAAGAEAICALTITYADEATGIARAVADTGIPVTISFTVETNGRLPDGTTLGDAIDMVDTATDGAVAWFGINCAHPTHMMPGLSPGAGWMDRIGQVRGNASRMSHADLDEADELDAGDPGEFGTSHRPLRALLPAVQVIGGCCGTDRRHVAALAGEWEPDG